MVTPGSGFEELPHTADWALRVWAASLPDLFVQAARGMNFLSGVKPVSGPSLIHSFAAKAPDAESLLVAFLSELVYLGEQEHLVFDSFGINLNGCELKASLSGAPILSINKSIKAVTYHNLKILKTDTGFEVEIVFDV